MPIFSIILPTYNRAELLKLAIQSVIDQRIEDWELIVIDDGSTDNTKEIVNKYIDHRIQYFYQENKGRSIARNIGISRSTGDWICFLDSDDQYTPNHLEIFDSYINYEPKSKVFKTGVQFKDIQNKVIFESKFKHENEDALSFFSTKYCTILDLCIEKKIAKGIRFENVSTWEDKAYILDILKENDIHQIIERTVIALEHGNRSILKTHEDPKEINIVLRLMVDKLKNHRASKDLISDVQQSFILSIIIGARNANISKKSIKSIISKLETKPSWMTKFKFMKAQIFNP